MTPPTPYYDHDGITIYCGDSRVIVPQLDLDGLKPLVVADVPYGISLRTDNKTSGRNDHAGLLPRFAGIGTDYPPVHGDDRPFDPSWLLSLGHRRILWGANHYASRLPDSPGWLVWDKQRPGELHQTTCELAWTDVVKGVRIFHHLWNGVCRASEAGKGNFVDPTQKPVALFTWCMSLRWTKDYTDIIDPYMGSGPAVRAAKDLGKRAIGIEIEEHYCAEAVKRLRQQVFSFG